MRVCRRRGVGSFFLGLVVGVVLAVLIAVGVVFWAVENIRIKTIEGWLGQDIIADGEVKDKNLKEFGIWFIAYVSDTDKLTLQSIDDIFTFSLPEHIIIDKIKDVPFSRLMTDTMDIFMDMTVSELLGEQTGILASFNSTKLKDMEDKFNTLTLSDLMTIDSTSPKILRSLANTSIMGLSDKFANLSLAEIFDDPNDGSLFSKLMQTNVDGQPANINNIDKALDNVIKEMTVSEFCLSIGAKQPSNVDIANQKIFDFFNNL